MTEEIAVKDYVFGLARQATNEARSGKMRFYEEGADKATGILVDRLVGDWFCNSADRDGNMHASCQLLTANKHDGLTAYLYHPDIEPAEDSEVAEFCSLDPADDHDSCRVGTSNPFPQGRNTHWRICYARELAMQGAEMFWRCRDERTGELWFVKGYEGPMHINFFDHGTHIFCDGPAYMGEDGIVRFSQS